MPLEKYLSAIVRFYKKQRRMPSYGEILKATGLKSRNSVHKIIKSLVEQNIIRKDATGHILPGKLWDSLRVLGSVEAGWPSPAEEELLDTLTLEEYLIDNKEATYMLKVSGDSMINAGIMPGDMVLVERTGEAKNGQIVIAEVDHQWTMKYFRKDGDKIQLIAANPKYKPIIPKEQIRVAAIVKAVIRKY